MRREMNEVFRDAHRDARTTGRSAVLRVWLVTTFDLARTAVAQQLGAQKLVYSASG